MRILFVDDDDSVRRALKREMRAAKLDAVIEVDGASALERLRTEAFDVLVTDETMPGMRGVELLARCRAEFPHVVRILLTGNQDATTDTSAVEKAMVFRVVRKPWDFDDLVKTLHEAAKFGQENGGGGAAPKASG